MHETIPINYPQTPGMPNAPHDGIGGFKKASELAAASPTKSKKKDVLSSSVLSGKSPRSKIDANQTAPAFQNQSMAMSNISAISMNKTKM